MDCVSKTKGNSGDQQSLRTSRNILPRASQSMKLQDKLKPEKPRLSYADFHPEITKNVKYVPHKFSGAPQKQQIGGKEVEEDELVKYMSKLPTYLQKGETVQEKALNVGVLDWGLLEKWQYSHKQMPYRCSRYSASSSNTSSSFSTDGSSSHSNRGHSCSPARRSTGRPSLQFHMMASSTEGSSQVKSIASSVEKFKPTETPHCGTLNRSEKFISTAPALFKKHQDVQQKERKKDQSDQNWQKDPGSGPLQNDASRASRSTVKGKTQYGECTNREEKTKKSHLQNFEHNSSKGSKTIVLLLPMGLQENNHPGHPQDSNSTIISGRRSERCQRSLPEGYKTAWQDELNSDIPHSCPLPSGVGNKESQVEQHNSINSAAVRTNCSFGSSYSVSETPRVGYNPCSHRNLEAKSSTVIPACSPERPKASDQKSKKVTAEKVRSTSPFYRFANVTGKLSRGSSSKDSLNLCNQSSTDVSAKSAMGKAMPSAGDASSSDKLDATGRARSSPLRRLLDPLLKPKAENCHHPVEPGAKVSVSTDRTCKSVDGQYVSLAMRSGKVKLGMTGCKKIDVNELAKDKKPGPATVQALLQVAVKNGLPLFTFAVNNESNILAATVKMLNTTKKDGHICIYTFFTIQNMKKKNGSWINQGGRGNSHDYISNVVAQMKVSDSGFSNLCTQNKIGVREFVLFSVDLKQTDNQSSEFQPNNELAAIVVKFPKKFNPSSMKDGPPANAYGVNSKDSLSGLDCHSNSVKDVQFQPFFSGEDFISTTVILPSAVHSLPSKGGPSSLIGRWSSGGSCDCGGWDPGCKVWILSNQNQVHKNLSSSKGCPITDRLELFTRGGMQENQQVFSLSPFKEGIYSVEFNSSLSILQAFSICTAVLDSRKRCEVSESRNPFEEKTFGEQPMLVQNAGTSGPSRIEGEVPRYMSYPPLSPVGRV
ncbi:hypothetical protein L484_006035 [Morus notabilis]|uniref:Uncharacterized protein n=1 Tax=Morus notabilis TaxID=981085 RepID=W9QEI4_9ROSA|nr:uncharacterized protein LOC21389482 [Morus notabilis]XP_024023720.1 uncharacterized protein LOC21389482 [Morus notabilis]XP_024023724.1 uncharacterized protein LOC21389482 [Morus notabilis]XP_024023728.1 uncharacterized protein LOC21389482 [Morus notabilis]EXB30485.1 hypothetical protein L484_006035 [Morus notabilis]